MPETATPRAPRGTPRYVIVGSKAKFHAPLPSDVERWPVSALPRRLHQAESETLFISYGKDTTDALLKARLQEADRPRIARLLAIDPPRAESVPSLLSLFKTVLGLGPGYRWLPAEELVAAITSDDASSRFIGGAVDPEAETVTLVRGDRETMVFPFSFFSPSGSGIEPDFGGLSFTDHGDTVVLGDYEAAADGILYESDVEYRRRLRESMRESERGLGPSLRRLRLQKKLGRGDFAPISAEAVARIERGEVSPSKPTLGRIAKRLGVAPEDIETY